MLQQIEAQIRTFKRNKGIRIIAFQKAKLSTTYKLVYCSKPKFEAIQRFVKPQRHLLRHSYVLLAQIGSLLLPFLEIVADSPLLKISRNFRSSQFLKKPNSLPTRQKKSCQLLVINSEPVSTESHNCEFLQQKLYLTLYRAVYKCLVWN